MTAFRWIIAFYGIVLLIPCEVDSRVYVSSIPIPIPELITYVVMLELGSGGHGFNVGGWEHEERKWSKGFHIWTYFFYYYEINKLLAYKDERRIINIFRFWGVLGFWGPRL